MRRVNMPVLLQESAGGTILLLLRNTDTFAEQALFNGSAFSGKVSVLPVLTFPRHAKGRGNFLAVACV